MGLERLRGKGRGRKTVGKEKKEERTGGTERRAHSASDEQTGGEELSRERGRSISMSEREGNARERAKEKERMSGQCACIAVSFHSGNRGKKGEKVVRGRIRYAK